MLAPVVISGSDSSDNFISYYCFIGESCIPPYAVQPQVRFNFAASATSVPQEGSLAPVTISKNIIRAFQIPLRLSNSIYQTARIATAAWDSVNRKYESDESLKPICSPTTGPPSTDQSTYIGTEVSNINANKIYQVRPFDHTGSSAVSRNINGLWRMSIGGSERIASVAACSWYRTETGEIWVSFFCTGGKKIFHLTNNQITHVMCYEEVSQNSSKNPIMPYTTFLNLLKPTLQKTVSAEAGVYSPTDVASELTETGRYRFFVGNEVVAQRDISVVGDSLRVLYFEDVNGNSVFDEGDIEIDPATLDIRVEKTDTGLDYDLDAGWNLVHIPLVDTRTEGRVGKISDLAPYWEEQNANLVLTHFAALRNGKFQIYSIREGGNEFGEDFDIVPGEGIFVLNRGSGGRVTFTGRQPVTSVRLNMSTGWNLVGVFSEQNYSAKSFIEKINQSLPADTISKFESGKYDSLVLAEDVYFGNDFSLLQTKGYMIRTSRAGQFTP